MKPSTQPSRFLFASQIIIHQSFHDRDHIAHLWGGQGSLDRSSLSRAPDRTGILRLHHVARREDHIRPRPGCPKMPCPGSQTCDHQHSTHTLLLARNIHHDRPLLFTHLQRDDVGTTRLFPHPRRQGGPLSVPRRALPTHPRGRLSSRVYGDHDDELLYVTDESTE